MQSKSASQSSNDAHSWLQEQIYAPKRRRTVDLVRQSVDALLKEKERISLSTVVAKSKELDFERRGISESAILNNQEARAYYEQYRSWRETHKKRTKPLNGGEAASLKQIKGDRDEQRVRQRYQRMSKDVLVERLLAAERTVAEQHERWIFQQDEVLTWRLRAETAESRIHQKNVT